MPSAAHCGRHVVYRCSDCEENHKDDYHGSDSSDITEGMRAFLTELADLMAKHEISFEAVDNGADYYPSFAGVEIYQASDYTTKDRPACTVRMDRDFKCYDIKTLLND